tara:strand:- start:16947 stop:17177 length:231 start_codon:yes stop_codon:yes gene_type:complete
MVVGGNPHHIMQTVIKMETHEQIIALIEQYKFENEKFISKQNKSAGIRARKILMEISKLCKTRRFEIQDEKEWIVK